MDKLTQIITEDDRGVPYFIVGDLNAWPGDGHVGVTNPMKERVTTRVIRGEHEYQGSS